jgi:hypothetical protein
MQTNVPPANASTRSTGYIPLDPAKKAPLHWTDERKRRVLWKYACLLMFIALIAGFVAGQLLPQVIGY